MTLNDSSPRISERSASRSSWSASSAFRGRGFAIEAMIRTVPRAVVCLPTYNEIENLEPMVRALGGVLDTTRDLVLVIDDSSPDGTGELADGLARELSWVEE